MTLKHLISQFPTDVWPQFVRQIPFRFVALFVVILTTAILSYSVFGDRVLPADVHVTQEVQGVDDPATHPVIDAMNWFGHAGPFLSSSVVIGAFLVARGRRWDALFIVIASVVAQVANGILKMTFGSPRPPDSLLNQSEQSSGLGFPSGHTMSIVVLLGCLTFVTWRATERTYIRALVAGTIPVFGLAMGFSRIHVGHHWPSDVLGAYLWGILVVLALIAVYQRGATVSLCSKLAPARVSASNDGHRPSHHSLVAHYDTYLAPMTSPPSHRKAIRPRRRA